MGPRLARLWPPSGLVGPSWRKRTLAVRARAVLRRPLEQEAGLEGRDDASPQGPNDPPGAYQSSTWLTMPSTSLGSNQVDLGGMMPPASDTASRSSMAVGQSAKATAISPELTRRSSSPNPRPPPTKSMRLSVRGSLTPRIGWIKLFVSNVIGNRPIGSVARLSSGSSLDRKSVV